MYICIWQVMRCWRCRRDHHRCITDVTCEAVRTLHAMSTTEAGWESLMEYRSHAITVLERVLQQHESMPLEEGALARDVLHRCRAKAAAEATAEGKDNVAR